MVLTGAGVLAAAGAAYALTGCSSDASPTTAASKSGQNVPFYGAHQAGILTPPQERLFFGSFDLLTDALSAAAGKPYVDLLQQRLTGPLGMNDTGVTPNQEQCGRLMLGSGLGGPSPCVNTAAAEGSGGVYSTGADMAKWIQFNLKMNPTMWEVPTVAETAYRPRQTLKTAIGFDEAGAMWGLGLAWVTMAADGARPMIVQKSGAGGGFMTYLAMAPGRDVGVFVAVNKVDFQMFFNMAKMANDLITNLTTR